MSSLRLVKPGESGPEPECVAQAEDFARRLVEHARAGGQWLGLLDSDDVEVNYYGDALGIAALTEEMARELKMSALGLA